MSWITVALIAIAALVVIALIAAIAWYLIARAGMKAFERAAARVDDDFCNFPRL